MFHGTEHCANAKKDARQLISTLSEVRGFHVLLLSRNSSHFGDLSCRLCRGPTGSITNNTGVIIVTRVEFLALRVAGNSIELSGSGRTATWVSLLSVGRSKHQARDSSLSSVWMASAGSSFGA